MAHLDLQLYEFGPFRLDAGKGVLWCDQQVVPLTPRLLEMLLAFVENSERVIEKDELMSRLWPDSIVEEANLTVNISALRKALGQRGNENRYIVTVPGRGYRFVAEVRNAVAEETELLLENHTSTEITIEEQEVDDPGASRALPKPGSSTAAPLKLRRMMLIASVIALALIAGAVYISRSGKPQKPEAGSRLKTIAVLPFKLLGGDADDYRGVGMADALITRLGELKQVNVRPTSAVRKYTRLEQDPVTAGRELDVEAVLEGSIRESGDRVRVTVQLVSVETGLPIWTDKFDENLTNVFAVEDRVSARVAEAIAINLTGEEKARLAKRYTENFEAYQEYLKGRFYASRRTPETVTQGMQHFERALEIDPNFALAHVALADSYVLLGLRAYSVLAPHDAMPKARSAALRALEIDDGFAEAHNSLAQVKMRYEWDWAGAEHEFKRALELNPGYAVAHQIYADLLFITGRPDEALAEVRLAQRIDPSALNISASHALYLYYQGQSDEALTQCARALEKDPNLYTTRLVSALAYQQKAMYKEAIAEAQKALSLTPGKSGEAIIGYIYAKQGRRDEALALVEQFKQSAKQSYVDPVYMAGIYSGLQDSGHAVEWLEKAVSERSPALIYLKCDPRYSWLHSNPRFQELLQRIGLNS